MTVAGRGDDGQATVELALVLPLVALFALFVAQVGVVVREQVLLTHATREAVRAASVIGGHLLSVQTLARESLTGPDAPVSLEHRRVEPHLHNPGSPPQRTQQQARR